MKKKTHTALSSAVLYLVTRNKKNCEVTVEVKTVPRRFTAERAPPSAAQLGGYMARVHRYARNPARCGAGQIQFFFFFPPAVFFFIENILKTAYFTGGMSQKARRPSETLSAARPDHYTYVCPCTHGNAPLFCGRARLDSQKPFFFCLKTAFGGIWGWKWQ